jgi:hypothetical protein
MFRRGRSAARAQIGIADSGAPLLPCHSTGHAGPHPAVQKLRLMAKSRYSQMVEVASGGAEMHEPRRVMPPGPGIKRQPGPPRFPAHQVSAARRRPDGYAPTVLVAVPADGGESTCRGPECVGNFVSGAIQLTSGKGREEDVWRRTRCLRSSGERSNSARDAAGNTIGFPDGSDQHLDNIRTGLMLAKRNVFAPESEDQYLMALSRCKEVLLLESLAIRLHNADRLRSRRRK